MNEAHIHLMVNHFPVVGLVFAAGFLAVAMVRKSDVLVKAGLVLVVVVAAAAIPAYISGEGAEEVVEHQPGISESLIHDHEEKAELAFVLALITGGVGFGALFMGRQKEHVLRKGAMATLAVSAVTLVTLGLTANSGGKISHPELRGDSPNASTGTFEEEREEDDHD